MDFRALEAAEEALRRAVDEIDVRLSELEGVVAQLLGSWTGEAAAMVEIDLEAFGPFVRKLFDEYCRTSNFVFRELTRGVLAPSLVMLQRAGRPIAAPTDEHRSFLDSLNQYAHSMPR